MWSEKGPDSDWVAGRRGRLWRLLEGTELALTAVWQPIRGTSQRAAFSYYYDPS